MSKNRSVPMSGKTSEAVSEPAEGPLRAWVRFWFAPADPIGLHAVRVLAGLLFIGWLLPFAGHVEAFFGLQGWFDTQAYVDAGRLPEGPPQPINWSILYLAGSNPAFLNLLYWVSILILALFTLGVCTRITAVLTWVIVVSFTANPVTLYDADTLLVILAFYLMIGYVFLGQWEAWLPPWARILGPSDTWLFRRPSYGEERTGSVAANLALRLLQVHFGIVMVASGLHKLQFGEWWSGAAFWYPLHPPLTTTFEQARQTTSNPTAYLVILSLGAYATLAWQIAFPFFAWRPRWRWLLIGGAVVGWLGLAFMYQLPLFGPAIFVCSLSYLTTPEWERLRDLLARVPGLGRLRRRAAAAQNPAPKSSIGREESSFVAARQR